MTSVGRCSFSISQAVVADLPVPVAPSRTTSFSPPLTRSASAWIAAGWSPDGSKSLTTVKRPCVGRRSVGVRTGKTVRRRCDRTDPSEIWCLLQRRAELVDRSFRRGNGHGKNLLRHLSYPQTALRARTHRFE